MTASPALSRFPTGAAVVVACLFAGTACTSEPSTEGAAADVNAPAAVETLASPDFAALRNDRPFNVVVVTLDTTRADRLGAYGFEAIETPVIDELASSGVMFRRAYSPVPLTLPAHTSLFTGTYPFDHGVHDNASFVVPEYLTTMAEAFREQGYTTAAFIASFVLDRRWGLSQGFDTYVDEFGAAGERADLMNDVQRPANEVIDEALSWLAAKPEGPFLAWIHLYDPHVPYEPPEPFASRYDDPYTGEIAFVDEQIGRFLAGLDAHEARDDTFIVLAADHGESLGEHDEEEHGFFVYEAAIRVPLVFWTPFPELGGVQSDALVSLVDVMPTVLEMGGIAAPEGLQGRSLAPWFVAGAASPERLLYAETYYPLFHYGWSALTSVRDDRYKLIISTEPELYDLREDPGETRNLAGTQQAERRRLEGVAADMVAGFGDTAAPSIALDPEERRKLESLGYVGSTGSVPIDADGPLPAPRSRIAAFNKSLQARGLMRAGRFSEAARLYEEIIAEDPRVPIVYERLGEIHMATGSFGDAVSVFRQAVPLKPDWPYSYINLAEAQLALGDAAAAERTMLDSLQLTEPVAHTYYLLGYANEVMGNHARALGYYEECLALDADSAIARAHMAAVYLAAQDPAAAEREARAALAIDSAISGVHFILAQIEAQRGNEAAALDAYLAEIAATPDHVSAQFNLAMIFNRRRQPADEERHLRRVLEIDPRHPRAALFLANIWLERGENYQSAVDLLMMAVQQPMRTQDLAAAYFRLSQLHERLGNAALAQQYLERARQLRQR